MKATAYNYAQAALARDEAKELRRELCTRDPLRIWQVVGIGAQTVTVRCIGLRDEDEEQSAVVVVPRRDVADMADFALRRCDDMPTFATAVERQRAEQAFM